jgi:hypothetical protein
MKIHGNEVAYKKRSILSAQLRNSHGKLTQQNCPEKIYSHMNDKIQFSRPANPIIGGTMMKSYDDKHFFSPQLVFLFLRRSEFFPVYPTQRLIRRSLPFIPQKVICFYINFCC